MTGPRVSELPSTTMSISSRPSTPPPPPPQPTRSSHWVKPEDIKIWFMCNSCRGCFHSVHHYLKHAEEAHPGVPVVMPDDLPPGAASGTVYVFDGAENSSVSWNSSSESDDERELFDEVEAPYLEKDSSWNNEQSIRDWVNQLQVPTSHMEDEDDLSDACSPIKQDSKSIDKSEKSSGHVSTPIVCKHCNKRFPKMCVLNFHMKKVHSEETLKLLQDLTKTEEQSNGVQVDQPLPINTNTATKGGENVVKELVVVSNTDGKGNNGSECETMSLKSSKTNFTPTKEAADDEVILLPPTSKKAKVIHSDNESLDESTVSSNRRQSLRKRKFSPNHELRRSSRQKNDISVIDITDSELSESNSTPKKKTRSVDAPANEERDEHASASNTSQSSSVKCLSDSMTDDLFEAVETVPKKTANPKTKETVSATSKRSQKSEEVQVTEKKSVACKICGCKCQDNAKLVQHMQSVHKDNKVVLVCGHCQMRFVDNKKAFNAHIKLHLKK